MFPLVGFVPLFSGLASFKCTSYFVEHPTVKSFSMHPGTIKTDSVITAIPYWERIAIDTLQLPAATVLKLTDGSGRFDWISGK